MKKCRRCGVNVDGASKNCPLCGAHVGDECEANICEYPAIRLIDAKQLFWQWSLFVSVFAVFACMVIDLIANKTISWSVHVMFGVALPWLCLARPLLLKFNLRKCMSWGACGIIALLAYLNLRINDLVDPWSFWLGAPIVVLVWQTALEVLCIVHKKGRADYEMSLTKIAFWSLVCIGISFAWLKQCGWGWFIAAGRGAIDVVALAIFAKRDYLNELKKRLHV